MAECMNFPIGAAERLHLGYAFTATVAGLDEREHPDYPDGGESLWRVSFDVHRVYRGRVGDRLAITGTNFGCGFLYGHDLNVGDRLFIASAQLDPRSDETDFYDIGDIVVWRQTGDRWA
jgi:hypothetical protein